MQNIPSQLAPIFASSLGRLRLTEGQRRDYAKWLRYYLDFCRKYRHEPEDAESLQPFLRKLSSKNQSLKRQEEATKSVKVYYGIVATTKISDFPGELQEEKRHPGYNDNSACWEECGNRLKEEIRLRQYSPKTLQTYRTWVTQFRRFLTDKSPEVIGSDDARRFLTHLAVDRKVAVSTQNQAFNALLFFYRHILKTDYDLGDKVVRAKRTKYIPVVLTRTEIDTVLGHLTGARQLAVQLLYGCGLRLTECLNLRVHCFNFDEAVLTVHDGKGKKDRSVPLPESLIPRLRKQLKGVLNLHEQDMREGYDGVFMPSALDRKWKNASRELTWQWFFPARNLTLIPEQNERRRYHMHESSLQKAVRSAVMKSAMTKRVTCHTFRHSFASHLLQANYDIRTIQEMLGHSDVRTTMIYTHTVKSRTLKEMRSPLDFETNSKTD